MGSASERSAATAAREVRGVLVEVVVEVVVEVAEEAEVVLVVTLPWIPIKKPSPSGLRGRDGRCEMSPGGCGRSRLLFGKLFLYFLFSCCRCYRICLGVSRSHLLWVLSGLPYFLPGNGPSSCFFYRKGQIKWFPYAKLIKPTLLDLLMPFPFDRLSV